jgi:SAM-dependent methyltransferase
MFIEKSAFCLDAAAKFHRSLYVSGWFHQPGATLQAVRLRCKTLVSLQTQINLPHMGVASLGANKGFVMQALLSADEFPEDATIEFRANGSWIAAPLTDLLHERLQGDASGRVDKAFVERLKSMGGRPRLLDIGGRNRSKTDRSKQFPYADVTVLDILPGENVDVVGDAHELSSLFEPESFDAVYSVSVFEHLLMPWKAAIEINKVLKTGGVGLIFTHQALGMHDEPWDFWRFSAHAWDGLFNRHTGFVVEDRAQSLMSFILPMLYRDEKASAERAVGYEASVVLVRKTGPTALQWGVPLSGVIETNYPGAEAA